MTEKPWRRRVPNRDGSELDFLLFEQDGVLTRQQALEFFSPSAVRHRLESGRWQLGHTSIYVTHSGLITPEQRQWVAVLSAGGGKRAPIAGLSALEVHGFRGYHSRTIHILIPARMRDDNAPPGVAVHRTGIWPEEHFRRGLPPRTSPARSLVDAASWAPNDDRARAIVAAAFQQRIVVLDEVTEALGRLRRARRRDLVRQTAQDAAGGSQSISELDYLRMCRAGGLPIPTRQSSRRDASGRLRFRDAYYETWRVHIEIDGAQHVEAKAWWDDMKRQNDIWISSDRILRFPAWLLRTRPAEVAAQVRAALIAAGWRP